MQSIIAITLLALGQAGYVPYSNYAAMGISSSPGAIDVPGSTQITETITLIDTDEYIRTYDNAIVSRGNIDTQITASILSGSSFTVSIDTTGAGLGKRIQNYHIQTHLVNDDESFIDEFFGVDLNTSPLVKDENTQVTQIRVTLRKQPATGPGPGGGG